MELGQCVRVTKLQRGNAPAPPPPPPLPRVTQRSIGAPITKVCLSVGGDDPLPDPPHDQTITVPSSAAVTNPGSDAFTAAALTLANEVTGAAWAVRVKAGDAVPVA